MCVKSQAGVTIRKSLGPKRGGEEANDTLRDERCWLLIVCEQCVASLLRVIAFPCTVVFLVALGVSFLCPPPQCQSCSSPPYERGRGKHNNEQVACIKLSPRVCTSFFPFPASSRGNKTFCSYWIVLLHFPFFS